MDKLSAFILWCTALIMSFINFRIGSDNRILNIIYTILVVVAFIGMITVGYKFFWSV